MSPDFLLPILFTQLLRHTPGEVRYALRTRETLNLEARNIVAEVKKTLRELEESEVKGNQSLSLGLGLANSTVGRPFPGAIYDLVDGFLGAWNEVVLGLDEEDPQYYSRTALYQDTRSWSVAIMKVLLYKLVKPDDRQTGRGYHGYRGSTPLHGAASNGRLGAVDFLLEAGANPNKKTNNGWTPLHYAATAGHKEVVDRLIAAGANPNDKANNGWTPLHFAANNGHEEIVRRLLEAGVNPNQRTFVEETPMQLAIQRGKKEVAILLAKAGAKPIKEDTEGAISPSLILTFLRKISEREY